MCALRLKVTGEKMGIITAYAPQSGREYDEWQQFFEQLSILWESIAANGPVCILGDLNSRIYQRLATEGDNIGEHYYKAKCQNMHEKLNRFLLLGMMQQHGLQLANSYFQHDLEETITYRDFGVPLHSIKEANPNRLAQLDIMLVPSTWLQKVKDVKKRQF